MNNYTIDPNYKTAVDNFAWPTTANTTADANHVTQVVTEVTNKIIAASGIRPMLQTMANQTFSLAIVSYLVVQDQDKKSLAPTVERINQASPVEKTVLAHSLEKLASDFELVQRDDVKAMTLLFGIHKVHALATAIIAPTQDNSSQVQQLEATIAKFEAIRNKYDSANLPPEQKAFVGGLDDKLGEYRTTLAVLKKSQTET